MVGLLVPGDTLLWRHQPDSWWRCDAPARSRAEAGGCVLWRVNKALDEREGVSAHTAV